MIILKARLITRNGKVQLLCADGTISNANDSVLKKMFIAFSAAESFHGKDGRWDEQNINMEDYSGKTLAWISKDDLLVIKENPFIHLVETVVDNDYIPLKEYAELQNRNENRIKVLCREGRLPGAIKKSGKWFIPKNTPYPLDARYSGIEK